MAKSLSQRVVGLIFGEFEREELYKFIRMGIIFSLIIGSYWTLRALKNSVFCNLADPSLIPWAKTASIIFLFPVVMAYTKLLDKYSREKMLHLLPSIYSFATVIFGVGLLLAQASTATIEARVGLAYVATKALAFLFYVFVESYGSLLVALFWAFATDVTMPDSAKRGFPLVVAVGQVGAIVGPYLLLSLPHWFNLSTSAIPVLLAALFTWLVVPSVRNFLTNTPKSMLVSYEGKAAGHVEEEPGFFEGLHILTRNPYLLGIFFAIFSYEFVVTVFDFNFQTAAYLHYGDTPAYTAFQGFYASLVNLVTLICLLLGVSNITRYLGVGVALALVPVIVAGAILGFIKLDSLNFLLMLMVSSKAINYALNGPAMKQLYIPTSHDARFKAQAWIETFGSRLSKEGGSLFNMLLKEFKKTMGAVAGRAQYLAWSSYVGFSLVAVWFLVAVYLGKKHKRALEKNEIVC